MGTNLTKASKHRGAIWATVSLSALLGASLALATPPASHGVLVHLNANYVATFDAHFNATATQINPNRNLYVVTSNNGQSDTDLLAAIETDKNAKNASLNYVMTLDDDQSTASVLNDDQSTASVLNQSTASVLNQSTASVLNDDQSTASVLNGWVDYYSSKAPGQYVNQPVVGQINAGAGAHALATGAGQVVAEVDDGIDQFNPVLRPVLVQGYNAIDRNHNASAWTDLAIPRHPKHGSLANALSDDQSTASVLNDQSTASVLNDDQSTASVLNDDQSTASVLNDDQSTASVLNQSTASVLNCYIPKSEHGSLAQSTASVLNGQSTASVLNDDQSTASVLNDDQSTASVLNDDQSTASVLNDDQSTASVLNDDQSTASVLNDDQSTASVLNDDQSTASVLNGLYKLIQSELADQSTASVLNDQSTASVLNILSNIQACNPDFGHGTSVAGMIHLVAPQASIMPIKAFDASGSADIATIVRGLDYAIDHNVNVLNLSFSATATKPELVNAIKEAESKGIIVAAAAGNSDVSTAVYPGSLPGVLGTGAIDGCDAAPNAKPGTVNPCNANPPLVKALFSNFSPSGSNVDVTVSAPGVQLFTTYPGFGLVWATVSGTSFSTPLVAGEAALLGQLGHATDACINSAVNPQIGPDSNGQLLNGNGMINVQGAASNAKGGACGH